MRTKSMTKKSKVNKKEKSTNVVKFVIRNFSVNHAVITKCLGVNPTSISIKGKKSKKHPRALPSSVNLWILRSSCRNTYDTDVQLDSILRRLKKFKNLKEIDANIECYISCFVQLHGSDSRPTIGLNVKQIKKLAEMNCGYDVDYYAYPESFNELRRSFMKSVKD